MNSSTITGIVFLVLLAGAGVATFFILKSRRDRERARIAAFTPVQREHHEAVIEYDSRLKDAERTHQAEAKARETRLASARKRVVAAEAMGSRKLGTYRGRDGIVTLTESWITTPQGTFAVDSSLNAAVDTAGNLATSSRSTFTRVAAGGILFGPVGAIVGGVAKKRKIHDMRELYLLVEGTGFASLVTCNPDDGPKVRQFAMTIKNAGMNAERMRQSREYEVLNARHALAAEEMNVQSIAAAQLSLETARTATARRESAAAALAAESTTTTEVPPEA